MVSKSLTSLHELQELELPGWVTSPVTVERQFQDKSWLGASCKQSIKGSYVCVNCLLLAWLSDTDTHLLVGSAVGSLQTPTQSQKPKIGRDEHFSPTSRPQFSIRYGIALSSSPVACRAQDSLTKNVTVIGAANQSILMKFQKCQFQNSMIQSSSTFLKKSPFLLLPKHPSLSYSSSIVGTTFSPVPWATWRPNY